jgi:hypothetical protein
MKVSRYAVRIQGESFLKFVMEIPIDGLCLTSDTKSLYQKMLDPQTSNPDCLDYMKNMVAIIEDYGHGSDI